MASAVSERAVSVLLVGAADDLESLLPDKVPREVDRAEAPAQAIARLAGKHYDVVLINHTAEGDVTEEQIAYMRALQAVRPGSKFILLVSHTTTRKVIEALRHGMFAYFSRPFDPCAVRDAIVQALSLTAWFDGIEVLSAAPEFISVRLHCNMYTADRLAQFMKELPGALSDAERSELSTAFREMLLNAIEHGGKFDPSEWVHVSRVRTKRTIVYYIHDPGKGFSRADLKHAAISNPPEDPTAHMEIRTAENMRAGGFGMLITSQLVDEVIYNQQGNEVILIKHLD
jgi:anti-sigma regulatory factor (Ser/Thr protein kinase)/CheY-like chemotaxis protein